MGAVKSGRIWLSAWGPPVEIPITRQTRDNEGADGHGRRWFRRLARAFRRSRPGTGR